MKQENCVPLGAERNPNTIFFLTYRTCDKMFWQVAKLARPVKELLHGQKLAKTVKKWQQNMVEISDMGPGSETLVLIFRPGKLRSDILNDVANRFCEKNLRQTLGSSYRDHNVWQNFGTKKSHLQIFEHSSVTRFFGQTLRQLHLSFLLKDL